jgi:hypothetical protein
MDEGIRIEDVACEISPSGLEALLEKKGAEVKVTRLELCVSESALNALLRRFGPGPTPPHAAINNGLLRINNVGDKPATIELQAGTIRLEITDGGLRLRTDPAP